MRAKLLILFLLWALPAHAFYLEGQCQSARSTSANPTITIPPSAQNGDIIVLVASEQTASAADMSVATSGWTIFSGWSSGSPTAGNNIPWHGTGAKSAVWTAKMSGGLAAAVITATANVSWEACAYYGVDTTTPIDAGGATATTNSMVISFPSVTPNFSNDELILVPTGVFAATPSWSTTYTVYPTTTTHGIGDPAGSITEVVQDCDPGASTGCVGVKNNPPEMGWFQQNQGPGPATPTSATTYTGLTSTGADNLGIALLLKSAAIAPLRHPIFVAATTNGPQVSSCVGIVNGQVAAAISLPLQLTSSQQAVVVAHKGITTGVDPPVTGTQDPSFTQIAGASDGSIYADVDLTPTACSNYPCTDTLTVNQPNQPSNLFNFAIACAVSNLQAIDKVATVPYTAGASWLSGTVTPGANNETALGFAYGENGSPGSGNTPTWSGSPSTSTSGTPTDVVLGSGSVVNNANQLVGATWEGVSSGIGYQFTRASSGGNPIDHYMSVMLALSSVAPSLQSIAVAPNPATIYFGNSQPFTAQGTYSDNSTKDVTANCTWTSNPGGIVTFSGNTATAGQTPGNTTITCTDPPTGVKGSLTLKSHP